MDGDVGPGGAEDVEREPPQDGQVLRPMIAAVAGPVFVEADVEHPMLAVVSRPEGFHLRPLVELCVRLSPHTAPIRRTRRQFPSASVRTDAGFSSRSPRGKFLPVSGDLQCVCIFAWPTPPAIG